MLKRDVKRFLTPYLDRLKIKLQQALLTGSLKYVIFAWRLHTYREEQNMSKAQAQKLDRKNFIVDEGKVRRLRKVLGAPSESAAIRVAVDRTLNAEEAIAALERLRKRGTWGKNLAY